MNVKQIRRNVRLARLSVPCLLRSSLARATLGRGFEKRAPEGDRSFVIYSIIPWEGVWQRPQHFAVRLAERYKVLYVDPMGLQHVVSATKPAPEVLTVNDHLTVFRPRILPGGKSSSRICKLNDALILKRLDGLLRDLKFGKTVLVTNTPLADEIAGKYPWEMVVYDVIDDFIAASWAPEDAAERERRLFARASVVFTGTYSLWEKKRAFHDDITFIPCGVETEHFAGANDPGTRVPEDIRDIRHPVFGYFGALNERIDAALLVRLAEAFPEGTVLLIGPVFADFGLSDFTDAWASVLTDTSSDAFRLKPGPDNMRFLGIRPYDTLPAYLKAFDVCLLPYVINDVTRDIHPVKVLEYLVSGRPVVATALPDIKRFYGDMALIAESREAFIENARKALEADDPEQRRRRVEFAAAKTWSDMTRRMLERITQRLTADDTSRG